MDTLPVLKDLANRGASPGMTFAFLSHHGMAAREKDYTCNADFARFLAQKVVPWLEAAVPGLQPGHHLIGGLSLSGLMSAYVTLQHPNQFRYCLSQSGSFWWHGEHFTKTAAKHAPIKNRFWLSVGDQETEVDEPPEVSQIVGVNNAHEALKTIGATVHYHEYHGGHDLKFWRAELSEALLWLFAQ